MYEDFGARSRYLRQELVIAYHSILWVAITYSCFRYQSANIWDPSYIIPTTAVAITPIGGRPSWNTLLTTNWILFFKIFQAIDDFQYIITDQMISLQKADEILQNITALWVP